MVFMEKKFKKHPVVSITYKCNRSCPYCFTAYLKQKFPRDMSLEDFKKMLKWLEKQGFEKLCFLGGESTVHPQFHKMLKIALQQEFKILLLTNNLFSRRILEGISEKNIFRAIINFNPPETYSARELRIFYNNLEKLKEKNIEVAIRFNVHSGIKSLNYVEEICKKFRIKQTLTAFTTPDLAYSRPYTSFTEMRMLFPMLKTTIENLEALGTSCLYSLPLPKCALPPKEYSFLEKHGARARCGYYHNTFMPVILIQPDLSVNACPRIPFRINNLLEYEKIEDIWSEFKPSWDALIRKPLFEECKNCEYYKNQECFGSCLVYKFAKNPEEIKYGRRT